MSRHSAALASRLAFVCGLVAWLLPAGVRAQITFSNLLETRVGHDPDEPLTPSNRFTLYDQFNLDWYHDALRLGFRYETYRPSDDKSLEFGQFTQRYAAWQMNHFEARVGNFEVLFGRGVVLRAFELPGVIREETGTPQFADSRDLDGVKLQARAGRIDAVVLAGNPRQADAPPTQERQNLVSAGAVTVEVARGVRLGGEYLRLDAQSSNLALDPPRTTEVPGATLQLSWDPWLRHVGIDKLSLDTFVEAAHATGLDVPAASSSPKVDANEGRGVYVAQNVFLDEIVPYLRWGLSWEYKDYQNFALGVNEPPTLVREQPYALLNRYTHEADLYQEEGYQFESLLHVGSWSTLILNWSRAENRNNMRFREFYAELQGHWRGNRLSVFHDDSDDDEENIENRRSNGIYAVAPLLADHSIEVDLEHMSATRVAGAQSVDFRDNYVAVTWAHAPAISVTATWQSTEDPFEVDAGSRRTYKSLSAGVSRGNHALIAFWGQRRGGLQCTAGTCYNVLDFDGVLFQVLSRF